MSYKDYKIVLREIFGETFSFLDRETKENYIEEYIENFERNGEMETYFKFLLSPRKDEEIVSTVRSLAVKAYEAYPEFC